jgi:hypothetical protein
MKSGTCVKCGAETVHEIDASGYADGGIAISSWYTAGLIHYVCTTCGFAEQYVAKKEALAKIAEKTKRVVPRSL